MNDKTKPKRRRSLNLSSSIELKPTNDRVVKTSGTLRDRVDRDKIKEQEVKEAVQEVRNELNDKVKIAEEKAICLQKQMEKITSVYLPVTKKTIDAEIVALDPGKLKVSSLSKRVQGLFDANDPNIQRLKKSLETHQDNLILVRRVHDELEVVYGTRRVFCANLINNERYKGEVKSEPFLIKALLASIPDIDVESLSHAENDFRTARSVYERALAMSALKAVGISNYQIADRYGVDEKVVRKSLTLAELDITFIKMLPSPQDVSLASGLKLSALVNSSDKSTVKKFLAEFKDHKFKNISSLVKDFEAYAIVQSKGSRDDQKPKEYKKGKVTKAKLCKHRKNTGQYKIDLFEVSENDKELIEKFLSDLTNAD